jgi:hypothetical protein
MRSRQQMNALRDVDASRRTLIANVSHDLRTPLTTLVTHLEAMESSNDVPLGSASQRYLQVALRQSRRIIRLVGQLLETAKLEAGQVVFNPEVFPIAELLWDVVQKFSLNEQNVKVELQVSSRDTLVFADIALLERVLDNLIENALRHAPLGSVVHVGMTEGPETLRVSVTDSGEGLTAEESTRVFDRFYRKEPGRSAPAGHGGLGLAIVQGILNLHSSRVRGRKQSRGRGDVLLRAACESFRGVRSPAFRCSFVVADGRMQRGIMMRRWCRVRRRNYPGILWGSQANRRRTQRSKWLFPGLLGHLPVHGGHSALLFCRLRIVFGELLTIGHRRPGATLWGAPSAVDGRQFRVPLSLLVQAGGLCVKPLCDRLMIGCGVCIGYLIKDCVGAVLMLVHR